LQRVFPPADERGGGQIEDQTAIHFRIEGEFEVVESAVGVAESGLFAAVPSGTHCTSRCVTPNFASIATV